MIHTFLIKEMVNMTIRLHQSDDDSLIEKVWCELGGQLPRERVSRVVTEVALRFQDARVKTFLPILIHRRTLERLNQELFEVDSADDCLPDE